MISCCINVMRLSIVISIQAGKQQKLYFSQTYSNNVRNMIRSTQELAKQLIDFFYSMIYLTPKNMTLAGYNINTRQIISGDK